MVDEQPQVALDPAWWAPAVEEEWDSPELMSYRLDMLAQKAAPDTLHRQVLEALSVATHAMLQPENRAEPSKPAIEKGGRRSPLPADLGEDHVRLLATVAPLVDNVPMRARIADVAWSYGDRKDLSLLSEAIDAYRAVPLQPEIWHMSGRASWQRALDLAQSRGRAEDARLGQMVQTLIDTVTNGVTSYGFMLVDLSELISRYGRLDIPTRHSLGEHFVQLAAGISNRNTRLARHFERAARQWFLSSNDEAAADDAMSRIASLYENEAQQRLAGGDGAALAAGLFLEKAIATIRELPRKYREANGLDIRLRPYATSWPTTARPPLRR